MQVRFDCFSANAKLFADLFIVITESKQFQDLGLPHRQTVAAAHITKREDRFIAGFILFYAGKNKLQMRRKHSYICTSLSRKSP